MNVQSRLNSSLASTIEGQNVQTFQLNNHTHSTASDSNSALHHRASHVKKIILHTLTDTLTQLTFSACLGSAGGRRRTRRESPHTHTHTRWAPWKVQGSSLQRSCWGESVATTPLRHKKRIYFFLLFFLHYQLFKGRPFYVKLCFCCKVYLGKDKKCRMQHIPPHGCWCILLQHYRLCSPILLLHCNLLRVSVVFRCCFFGFVFAHNTKCCYLLFIGTFRFHAKFLQ